MPAAVNGNEFHLNFGFVAPEDLLDVKSVGHLGLARFGRAGNVGPTYESSTNTRMFVRGAKDLREASRRSFCFRL